MCYLYHWIDNGALTALILFDLYKTFATLTKAFELSSWCMRWCPIPNFGIVFKRVKLHFNYSILAMSLLTIEALLSSLSRDTVNFPEVLNACSKRNIASDDPLPTSRNTQRAPSLSMTAEIACCVLIPDSNWTILLLSIPALYFDGMLQITASMNTGNNSSAFEYRSTSQSCD